MDASSVGCRLSVCEVIHTHFFLKVVIFHFDNLIPAGSGIFLTVKPTKIGFSPPVYHFRDATKMLII